MFAFRNLSFFFIAPHVPRLAFSRVILGRDGQETELKHMEHEGKVNIYWPDKNVFYSMCFSKKNPQKTLQICSPGEIKAFQKAVRFRGTYLKPAATLKMSLGYHVALNSSALVLHV